MTTLSQLSNDVFSGATDIADHHPFAGLNQLEEVAEGVASISSFANVAAIATNGGLVLIDTGGPMAGDGVRSLLRTWSHAPVHSAVYTHGHIDHIMGTVAFDNEATNNGNHRIHVIGHESVGPRLDRYCLTAGYNANINQRQFQVPGLSWPTDYRRPDQTYRDELTLRIGGTSFELHHDRGETDDHTWVWIPEHRVLCTGDLFIWCVPNAGNPQKVQRYAKEWALGLRKMAALHPEVLLPGHGIPIIGDARVQSALLDTADLLDALVDQTLSLMNKGAPLDEIIHSVTVPEHLTTQPYLQPIYDEPEFIVRNVHRLYGGWYDGNPAHLKPASDAAVGTELAELCGGAAKLAERARVVADGGDLRLAGNLIEFAAAAAPDDPGVHAIRARLMTERAEHEQSLMATGIFRAAAADSARIADRTEPTKP